MAAENFEKNVDRALADAQLRKNFAFAMGNFILKRKAVFSDEAETEQLRARGQAIKQRALSRLPELLEELEANCTRNGIRVHWAETPAVANRIVLDIVTAHSATGVVKGKSMVSEEMHLNAYLATHGVEPIETDLGAGHPMGFYAQGKPGILALLQPLAVILQTQGAGVTRLAEDVWNSWHLDRGGWC